MNQLDRQNGNHQKSKWNIEEITIRIARILSSRNSFERSINDILEELSEIIFPSRIYILEIEKNSISNTFEWCAPGIEPEIDNLKDVDLEEYSSIWDTCKDHKKSILLKNIELYKKDKPEIYEILRQQNTKNFIETPLYYNDTLLGFIGANNFKEEESEDVKELFESVAYFLASRIELRNSRRVGNEQFYILKSLADAYFSMSLINLEDDTVEQFKTNELLTPFFDKGNGAVETMKDIMTNVIGDDYRKRVLKFTDLSTLPKRLKQKKMISAQFKGIYTGWFIASFISIDVKMDGTPTRVMFTTLVNDEQKREEESLRFQTITDELTGLYNRREYENKLDFYRHHPIEEDFVFLSFDVNRLKFVNDNLGHAAGDELICGAASCMEKAFSQYGTIYRTGGDEFAAIIHTKNLDAIEKQYHKLVKKWSGKLVKEMTISYGAISRSEHPYMSIDEIVRAADKLMYDWKKKFYEEKGCDRRIN